MTRELKNLIGFMVLVSSIIFYLTLTVVVHEWVIMPDVKVTLMMLGILACGVALTSIFYVVTNRVRAKLFNIACYTIGIAMIVYLLAFVWRFII